MHSCARLSYHASVAVIVTNVAHNTRPWASNRVDYQCCCPDICLVCCKTCDSGKQDDQECGNHLIVKPPQCLCSDVPVQGGPTRTTCAQQYNVGNCGQAFLKDSIEAIPEGMQAAFAKTHPEKNRVWCCCDDVKVKVTALQ